MIVKLIASTVVYGWENMREAGWVEHPVMSPQVTGIDEWNDADYLAEFAGRLCYQSWDRPNPATATNDGYLANILAQQHFSVLEHASATFYVAEVSRSLSHEFVRHRHLSFSQVSQRYVEHDGDYVVPPAILRVIDDWSKQAGYDAQGLASWVKAAMENSNEAYEVLVNRLTIAGLTRKQIRQAARCVLPNMTKTKFVVTGNMRAWREVIAKRRSSAADEEIRQLANEMLVQLREIAPNTFQDM